MSSLSWLLFTHKNHRAGTDCELKVDGLPEAVGETRARNAIGHLCSSYDLLQESNWANCRGLELKLSCKGSLSCRCLLWPNSYFSAPRNWIITCLLVSSLSTHHLLQCGSSKERDNICASVWISGNILLAQKLFWKNSATTRNRKRWHKLLSKAKLNMQLSEVEQTINNGFSLTHFAM